MAVKQGFISYREQHPKLHSTTVPILDLRQVIGWPLMAAILQYAVSSSPNPSVGCATHHPFLRHTEMSTRKHILLNWFIMTSGHRTTFYTSFLPPKNTQSHQPSPTNMENLFNFTAPAAGFKAMWHVWGGGDMDPTLSWEHQPSAGDVVERQVAEKPSQVTWLYWKGAPLIWLLQKEILMENEILGVFVHRRNKLMNEHIH